MFIGGMYLGYRLGGPFVSRGQRRNSRPARKLTILLRELIRSRQAQADQAQVNPVPADRVLGEFWQAGKETGRFSSATPNQSALARRDHPDAP
jgi:hypothetical protein